MSETEANGLFFNKPAEVAIGRVTLTPDAAQPYKVVFRLGDRILSEYPAATVREGEALIRRELPRVRFSAQQERPDPKAPQSLSAVERGAATD